MPDLKEVRIPGKIMLSGEYAVLYGGAAVMLPVQRFLRARESNDPPLGNPSQVVEVALRHQIPEISEYEMQRPLKAVTLDSTEFFETDSSGGRSKLGLGLSAAEAVAVTALRLSRAGLEWESHRPLVLKHALEIHRRVQGGLGSGADVAECTYGRPLIFSLDRDELPRLESIDLPQRDLPLNLVWSGQSADTRQSILAFQRWANSSSREAQKLLRELVDCSRRLARAWSAATTADLFSLLDEYDALLSECTRHAGVDYKQQVHRRLEAWARSQGGRAKPTGAGGGDLILMLGHLPWQELDRSLQPLDPGLRIQ